MQPRYRKFKTQPRKPRDQFWVEGGGGFWWNGRNWHENTKGNHWYWGPERGWSMTNTAWVDSEKELINCTNLLRIARIKVGQAQSLEAEHVQYRMYSGRMRRFVLGIITFRGI